jgi:hypothetical protein
MKKIFVDNEYSYDLEQTENKVSLCYSNNGVWTNPGQHIFSLVDDGNSYRIEGNFYKEGKIQYDELTELYILFAAFKDCKVEVVEEMREL